MPNASSDLLLEQSTIGASPNVKLLDYLKYAVYSQVMELLINLFLTLKWLVQLIN